MSSFNVITGNRPQVLVDEQQFKQMQAEFGRRGLELERLKSAFETLSAVNAPAHFVAASMALCNELASRWKAERVGIGFLKGRYVRLRALSHTEKITRNMQLVQDIEGAMEECLDQDMEVIFPPPKDAPFVYRSTEILANRDGCGSICSLPLRRAVPGKKDPEASDVVAVLTVERKADQPFKLEEIEALRLTCDLFVSRLYDLHEHDIWLGAKAVKQIKRGLWWLGGPKHTWAKLAAIAVAGIIAFACFFNGNYKVEAPFVFQAVHEQIVTSPAEGTIDKTYVKVNDIVLSRTTADRLDALKKGSPLLDLAPLALPPTLMAEMRTTEWRQTYFEARGEMELHLNRARQARAEGQQHEAEAKSEDAQADEAKARMDKAQYDLEHSKIESPVDGIVFSDALEHKDGTPVKAGEELYHVGQLDLRAEMSVPEEQIGDLAEGTVGELRSTSYPQEAVHFTVEMIPKAGEVSAQAGGGGKNVFKVHLALNQADMKPWMKPGVEGLAKINVRQERYVWIWTHRMVNWVELKWWSFF